MAQSAWRNLPKDLEHISKGTQNLARFSICHERVSEDIEEGDSREAATATGEVGVLGK